MDCGMDMDKRAGLAEDWSFENTVTFKKAMADEKRVRFQWGRYMCGDVKR